MFGKPDLISCFYGEYKTGLFGKKNQVSIYVYDKFIEGSGIDYFAGKLNEHKFEIEFQYVKAIEEKCIEGNKNLVIDYVDKESVCEDIVKSVMLPNLDKHSEAMGTLSELWERNKEQQRKKLQEEQARREAEILEIQKHNEECQEYYEACYHFHIVNNNNPYYELKNGELQFAGIYIDKEKNINFLKIDGYNQEESNACIPYGKIHYYEKAGNVHYISEINSSYSSYGGTITGATVSKKASILGGVLFGAMGMATGAMLTYKPARVEMPTYAMDISSEPHKIDDRSVILNYYSDVKKQFIDIELPADMYNFFQTHLPEKKYSIVLAIEKKSAIEKHENEMIAIETKQTRMIAENSDADSFESKIRKLKMMYDNGILTEEEFSNEKKRILSEL